MNDKEQLFLKTINFKNKIKNIKEHLKGKRVLIYGAGILFKTAYEQYDFSGIDIVGISDLKFEKENIPSWHNIKTCKPSEIVTLNPDIILITLKEYVSLYRQFISKFNNIEIVCLFCDDSSDMFKLRNINHNYWIELNGLHGKKHRNLNSYEKFALDLKMKLNQIFKRIDIPQIEFTLTTKCTLRCKHCTNYIPTIDKDEHVLISIDDFKIQLDNLLKAVNEVKNLLLIGGEPLLVKNLHEYLEYSASKKNVKRVWIVTNGTLLLSQDLLNIISKYKNKVTVWISNYSKNEELKNKLHHKEILKQLHDINADIDYLQDMQWSYNSPLSKEKLRENSTEYFRACLHPCVAVFGGKVYVCPRAGVFDIKRIYNAQQNEIINLNIEKNPAILKKKLIDFYSRNSFSACNYCSILGDVSKTVMPAIQLDYFTDV